MNYIKKNIWSIVVLAAIIGIAMCNYRLNTSLQNDILENPEPGDYFVFQDYPNNNDESILKVKEILDDGIVFYVPHGEIIGGFALNKSETAVRDADQRGQMYGDETVTISLTEVLIMVENNSLSGATSNKPRLENVFK